MIRDLTENEIRELLEHENYGHIAYCETADRPYVTPITFVYHENALHSFSFTGEKIAVMRKNPKVCFQTERLRPPTEWRSAVAHGTFEELSGPERDAALSLILDRLWQESNKDHPLFLPFRNSARMLQRAEDGSDVVLYRINIHERSGRLEQYE